MEKVARDISPGVYTEEDPTGLQSPPHILNFAIIQLRRALYSISKV